MLSGIKSNQGPFKRTLAGCSVGWMDAKGGQKLVRCSILLSVCQELPHKKSVDTKGAESLDFSKTILIQICESTGLLKSYIMISLCKYPL